MRAAEPPSRPAAFATRSSASISDELQVLSALSAIGADLGDPVEVALTDGKVVVTGAEGIPASRQNAIRNAVASLPHVEVAFGTVHPAPVAPEVTVGTAGIVSPISGSGKTRETARARRIRPFQRASARFRRIGHAASIRST